jgi:hypothetical protein
MEQGKGRQELFNIILLQSDLGVLRFQLERKYHTCSTKIGSEGDAGKFVTSIRTIPAPDFLTFQK